MRFHGTGPRRAIAMMAAAGALASAPTAAQAPRGAGADLGPRTALGSQTRHAASPLRTPSLQTYTERQRALAASELRALARDAERRTQEDWLARHGSPQDVERHQRRVEAEDALDELIDRQELLPLAPTPGYERFGPVTGRLLERSRIELRWVERRRGAEIRLHQLERSVEPPGRDGLASPPAPPLPPP